MNTQTDAVVVSQGGSTATVPPPLSFLSVNCPRLPPSHLSTLSVTASALLATASAQHVLDFGECPLSSTRTCSVPVFNRSDTPTTCHVVYSSAFHTVNVTPSELQLKPKSSASLTITVQAHQLNPNYRKLIILRNESNPNNSIAILIRSVNVCDTNGAFFHSQYYEVTSAYSGPMLGLPPGYNEMPNGKIKLIVDDDGAEDIHEQPSSQRRRHGVTGKIDTKLDETDSASGREVSTPVAAIFDDSDWPSNDQILLMEPIDRYPSHSTSGSSSASHSSATSPVPVPISPGQQEFTSVPPANLIQNYRQQQQRPLQQVPNQSNNATPNMLPNLPLLHQHSSDGCGASALTSRLTHIPLGTLICQQPIVRMIEVKNVTNSRLRLRLHTSLDADREDSMSEISEMRLFVKNEEKFFLPNAAESAEIDDSIAPLSTPNSVASTLSNHVSPPSLPTANYPTYLAAAASPPLSPILSPSLPVHVTDSWNRFLNVVLTSEQTAIQSHFHDLASERSYVKKFILQRRDIDTVIKERIIIPMEQAQSNATITPSELQSSPNSSSSATSVSVAASCKRILQLEPLETKQVFIYFNIQSHLPIRPPSGSSTTVSTSTSATSPPSQPTTFTFANKDFLKNKIIRLDEKEIRLRDLQMTTLPPNALSQSKPSERSSAIVAPTAVAAAAPSSILSPLPPKSTGLSAASSIESLPSLDPKSIQPSPSSFETRAEPGLKMWLELVEFPSAQETVSTISISDAMDNNPKTDIADSGADISYATSSQQSSSSSLVIRTVYPPISPPPTRWLSFPAYLCRSALEVAQKHINFGQLLNMDVHSKSLVLSNLSEVPLLFMVKQTGSIASLDLTFPKGDIGVIPPQGYTDLPFLFKPSLAGKFLEPITILNVEDTSNSRVINVKAYLRKPVHFWIQNLRLDFRICCGALIRSSSLSNQSSVAGNGLRRGSLPQSASMGSISSILASAAPITPIVTSTQRIVVKNISLKARTFKIQMMEWTKRMVKVRTSTAVTTSLINALKTERNDKGEEIISTTTVNAGQSISDSSSSILTFFPTDCPSEYCLPCVPSLSLKLEDVALGASLSLFEREEEEEKLNHKLRIAIRKKKLDKVEKIRNRLSELRDMKMEQQSTTASSNDAAAASGASGADGSSKSSSDKSHPHTETHDSMEGLIFTLEPNAVQNVRATFAPAFAPLSNSLPPHPHSQYSFIEFYDGVLHVFETKNKEIIEEVKCSIGICSDVETQQDFLSDSSKWTASGEEAVEVEEGEATEKDDTVDEEDANAETDSATSSTTGLDPQREKSLISESDAQRAEEVSSNHLGHAHSLDLTANVDDMNGSSSTGMVRSKSMPDDILLIEGEASVPIRTHSLLPVAPASLPPVPQPASILNYALDALQPRIASAAVQQLILAAPTTLPASLMPILQSPHSFPSYSSSNSSASVIAQSLRSHTNFYQMLSSQNGATQLSTPPSPNFSSTSPIPFSQTEGTNLITRKPLLPFTFSIPLEFLASTKQDIRSRSGNALLQRNHHSGARSASPVEMSSSEAVFDVVQQSLGSLSTSVFRVYIEDQIPLSLPSPSFFTLKSNVPAAMILEIKWIPDVPLSALDLNRMPLARSSSMSGSYLPNLSASTATGGFMRVFVKPGTSLLVPTGAMHDSRSRSGTSHSNSRTASRATTAASAHHLPSSSSTASSSLSPAPSLFVFLPAHGELDVFMCWLASLASLNESSAVTNKPRAKQLRRSSSSMTHLHPTTVTTSTISSYEAEHSGAHRWKKGITLADPSIMQEAILAPSIEEKPIIPEEANDVDSDALQSNAFDDASTVRPKLPRATTAAPSTLSPHGPQLPRGQLLIRPVAVPHVRSMIGVEVCSVIGSATQTAVSPLMLTPERIHAGVVLVDTDRFQDAEWNEFNNVASKRLGKVGNRTSSGNMHLSLLSSSVNSSGIVRGRFVIYNSMTSRSSNRGVPASGKVCVVFGQQSKNTLTSVFVPPHQRAQFSFKPARASIPPSDRRVIEFQCHVRTLGHQTHGILVRDLTHDIDMVLPVTFTAKEPAYVHLKDSKEGEFNVGLIYAQKALSSAPQLLDSQQHLSQPHSHSLESKQQQYDPNPFAGAVRRFAKVVAFRLENLRDYSLRVAVSCNLQTELHVYDGETDRRLERCISCKGKCSVLNEGSPQDVDTSSDLNRCVILSPRSVHRLLLAFSPVMTSCAPSVDHCRSLIAGLSFLTYPHLASAEAAEPVAVKRFGSRSPSQHPHHSHHHHSPSSHSPSPASTPSLKSTHRSSVRFIQEEQTEDIIEYEVEDDDDERTRSMSGSDGTTTEEELEEEYEHEIGSVISSHEDHTFVPHQLLSELHVRIKATIGVTMLTVSPAKSQLAQSAVADVPHVFVSHQSEVSSIDFFTSQLNELPSLHAPLQYSLQLTNSSSSLPLCYRIVTSSSHVKVKDPTGCLTPHSSDQGLTGSSTGSVQISFECPAAGLYQEWLGIYVAQQPSVDYRKLNSACCAESTIECTSPHHASETPHPPSMDHEVTDLLGLREQLVHTVFLRCFIKDDRIETDLPTLLHRSRSEAQKFQSIATQHHVFDLGAVYVQPTHKVDVDPQPQATASAVGSPSHASRVILTPPEIPFPQSKRVARFQLLESILHSNSSSSTLSNLLVDTPNQGFPVLSLDKQLSLSPLALPNNARSGKDTSQMSEALLPLAVLKNASASYSRLSRPGANGAISANQALSSDLTSAHLPLLDRVHVSTVESVHRSFLLRNTSSETLWIWVRSDADANVQVNWAQTPCLPHEPSMDEADSDACACGHVTEEQFQLPQVEIRPDGTIGLRYNNEVEVGSDTLSPESITDTGALSNSSLIDDTVSNDPPVSIPLHPLYINSHMNSSDSLASDPNTAMLSALRMGSNDSAYSVQGSPPINESINSEPHGAKFDFHRTRSFDEEYLNPHKASDASEDQKTYSEELLMAPLPSPTFCGEVAPDVQSSVCDCDVQLGSHEMHPAVPASLLLRRCSPTLYQLPPGKEVFAHVTFKLDSHPLATKEDIDALNAGQKVTWRGVLMVHTQSLTQLYTSMQTGAAASTVDANRTSAAIRFEAQLVQSHSSWQFDPSIPTASSVSTDISIAPSIRGTVALRFVVHTLYLPRIRADSQVTYLHQLINQSDIPLHIRVLRANVPAYLKLQHVPIESTIIGPTSKPGEVANEIIDESTVVDVDPQYIELSVPPRSTTSISFTIDPVSLSVGQFACPLAVFNRFQPQFGHAVLMLRGELSPGTVDSQT